MPTRLFALVNGKRLVENAFGQLPLGHRGQRDVFVRQDKDGRVVILPKRLAVAHLVSHDEVGVLAHKLFPCVLDHIVSFGGKAYDRSLSLFRSERGKDIRVFHEFDLGQECVVGALFEL